MPDKIKSNYTLAIPIVDTTVSVGYFVDIQYYSTLLEAIQIPEDTPIDMGEQSYPFYIGDYSASQEIEWVEPHLIIDTKDLPSGTKVNIRIYTKNEYKDKVFFWLPSDYSVTLTDMPLKVPDTPNRITNIEQFRSAKNVYLDVSLTYPTAVSGAEIVNDELNIKFAIKFAIKTDLKLNI
ncbi:MAG: hypothetical protein LBF59_08970 [Prevotellaceae bacterium]|nr:hypothetical protein [Prevotellaceae bacterium]